ncbi:MAG: hypothetical protein K8R90_02665 [Candidatus Cloacimonetes bacterium]|nr:hypothetical protein [Candidatus Cloacimonadota bacterium]
MRYYIFLLLLFTALLTLSAEVLWEQTYLITEYSDELGVTSVTQCADGGFLLSGWWYWDWTPQINSGWVVRTDANGLQQWVDWDTLSFPNNNTNATHVFELQDGSVVSIGCYHTGHPGNPPSGIVWYFTKRNADGQLTNFVSQIDSEIGVRDAILTENDNILLAGHGGGGRDSLSSTLPERCCRTSST